MGVTGRATTRNVHIPAAVHIYWPSGVGFRSNFLSVMVRPFFAVNNLAVNLANKAIEPKIGAAAMPL